MPAPTPYSSGTVFGKMVKNVEWPVIRLFTLISKWLPEPSFNDTNKHNCHILIGVRDRLLDKWKKQGLNSEYRLNAIRTMFNMIIQKYDRDNVNGGYLDDMVREFKACDWIFRTDNDKKRIADALEKKEYDKIFDLMR